MRCYTFKGKLGGEWGVEESEVLTILLPVFDEGYAEMAYHNGITPAYPPHRLPRRCCVLFRRRPIRHSDGRLLAAFSPPSSPANNHITIFLILARAALVKDSLVTPTP